MFLLSGVNGDNLQVQWYEARLDEVRSNLVMTVESKLILTASSHFDTRYRGLPGQQPA